ncbi:ATP-dependent zinc metalloprotease FtsH [Paenibacillus solanacearum]|uniref:ATP-dependent zinc metalloprotease FtsH n=1 Tax=Paenibacillus solanacearum TaxID=2048548 RepID=A0A916K3H5_9BACL|nr:AAA family ATPase [Paenibacillus solanacearum]CAG7638881.1 ATP-dependent zinc metalloprotease FtsH [Paenibacillus solanacearum]
MRYLSFSREPYAHPMDHLADELIRLDMTLELELQRMKSAFQGLGGCSLYRVPMSAEEAEALLEDDTMPQELASEHPMLLERLDQTIASRLFISGEHGMQLPLVQLQRRFRLSELDMRFLVAAVAPHAHRKYGLLFAYMQGDAASQYATLGFIMELCARSGQERRAVLEQVTAASGRLHMLVDKEALTGLPASSLLMTPLLLDQRVVHYILGLDWAYEGALSQMRLYSDEENAHLPPSLTTSGALEYMCRYSGSYQAKSSALIWMLHGPPGAGKTYHARQVCAALRRPLLEWDLSGAPTEAQAFAKAVDRMLLEAKLQHAIPAFDKLHELSSSEPQDGQDNRRSALLRRLASWEGIAFLCGETSWKLPELPVSTIWLDIRLEPADLEERRQLWKAAAGDKLPITEEEAGLLAWKFRFTIGQMLQAVGEAQKREAWRAVSEKPESQAPRPAKQLHQAAYRLISHRLEDKAVKLTPAFGWDDLILPDDTVQLLRQACGRIQLGHTVMTKWGFDRKLAYGKGVSMLFTGPPGTGKTMSAMVMAREMDAELYRVDLSRVVSKYIGETEKHLSDIFDQARLSGAILFFDEADALFGKRSEVKDAHDKYANMETSYLLQKMEEYDGITILATNFAQNLDEAFTRRIQFIIKYPFPDAAQREQLWRSTFPPLLPVGDIDYTFLAQTFDLSGGSIKNIVLTASYLAASERESVSMKQLIEGTIQEYKKTGKQLLKDRLGAYAGYWKG